MYVVNRNSTKHVVFVHLTQFSTFEEDIRERRNEEGVRWMMMSQGWISLSLDWS